ncbi:MAG TPA: formate dehydrogenase subunit gamma [Blastocatellia bacterium]|nr:formate dehydrogenase subunit gamma [Blastocatellia bacterium]
MTTSVERFDEKARREFDQYGRTNIREGELLRHPVYTRFLHWSVAIFFILALLSGLAIYSPWLFRWLTPLFGGGPMTRFLHPWFALLFTIFFVFQFLNWLAPMRWTGSDRKWLGHLKAYVTNSEKVEPEYVGTFNAGQKLYFWAIVASTVVFLLTGLIMWFPEVFGRILVAISYVLHDIAAVVMLAGFIIHIYEGTAAQPGTFHAMTRGTVREEWAWTHHPAWYAEVTGRDPREDYKRAVERQAARRSAREEREREADSRERGPTKPPA